VEEAAVALREKLQRATALRMLRSDVPVGSYLSGGLDSSFAVRLGREAKEGPFATFSLCFDDAEFDESHYQRLVARTLESEHVEVHITRADIARVFPEVIYHTEKPILRTAPAPMFLLSKAVRDAGIKAVLAGEGGDEFLGGYDLYREAKIREFWSRDPKSVTRPKLFERIYPYLARSPQHAKGLSYEFWRRGLERVGTPGFSHEPRWWTTALLKKFYSRDVRDELTRLRVPDPLEDLPPEFQQWDLLGRAQYLEVVTLFSSYLISSQGDRMLLGHSVEGRFPYLDPEVIEFAGSLPSFYKLAGLDEKHVLKRAARGLVPDQVHQRKKQPYRAPDAVCFIGRNAPEFVADALSASAIGAARLFDPRAVESLLAKCDRVTEGGVADGALSNTDNMAVVGILSAQLVHEQFARATIKQDGGEMTFTTTIDRVLCESPAHLED
jgi:asparagine synthase (glutamine-hydrolysing)